MRSNSATSRFRRSDSVTIGSYDPAMSRPSQPSEGTVGQTKSGGHRVDIHEVPGYLVIESGAQWICGRAEIRGEDIVLASGTREQYDLYERDGQALRAGRPELALALAAVENPYEACAVARRYGLLLRGPNADIFREPFSIWKTVAGQARLVLRLALALRQEDTDDLDALIAPWRHRLDTRDAGDTIAQASALIEGLLNDGLQHTREAVVAAARITQEGWRGPGARWFFAPQFDNLVGYAFHRLAQMVSYRLAELLSCAHCGRVYLPEHGNQIRYCTPRCAAAAKKRRQRARARA
jgi:hypothetical protein